MIKRFSDIEAELNDLRASGVQRGDNVGFGNLDALYSIKQGSYTIVLGSPTHGKSEFIFELLFNQATEYGKRSLIYSPETGSAKEIAAELIHKFTGKGIYQTNDFHCDDKEYEAAKNWLGYHFVIADGEDQVYSFQELADQMLKFEKDNKGEQLSCLMAEPYNELKHDMKDFGTRQDLYIEDLISEVRRFCKKNNKHVFLSLHPAHQSLITKDGFSYYPKPLPREAAGGQALFRKAMTWITLWRPPVDMLNDYGQKYKDNEVVVSIDKAKPKGVATKGETSLFFNWKSNRYYEQIGTQSSYAFDHAKGISTLQPSKEFDMF